MSRNKKKIVLATGDYLVMLASLLLVVLIRYGVNELPERIDQHMPVFAVIFLLWVTVFYVFELYDLSAPFRHRNFYYAMTINVGLAMVVFYLFPDALGITPRRNLLLIGAAVFLLFYGWRFLFNRIIDKAGWQQEVAIIGAGSHALHLAEHIAQRRRLGFRVAAIVCEPERTLPETFTKDTVARLGSIDELRGYALNHRLNTVVISEEWLDSVYRELYNLIPLRLKFYQLTTFWEFFEESIPIYNARETWFLENLNRGPSRGYRLVKRLADLAGVIVFSPLFVALAILTALLVRISSPGPVLFSQIRVGRNGMLYRLYKFRSMRTDAERDGAQWAQENDPRITAVGKILRATRLDEIPQVFNVLKGEMSFVGPRPERPEFVSQLEKTIPHYQLRHLVKPGLTGWAQVKYRYGASEEDAATKLTYDLYYVKNVAPVLDIKILLKTVMTILGRQGR